jgi:hypothetical protein
MIRSLFEHILPKRLLEPLQDERPGDAVDAAKLVNAQVRQFALETQLYSGLRNRAQRPTHPREQS